MNKQVAFPVRRTNTHEAPRTTCLRMALPGDPFSLGSVTNRGAQTVSELVALNGVVFARPPPVLATLSGPEKCQNSIRVGFSSPSTSTLNVSPEVTIQY